jgi:predicted small lipoprotein YifL
MRCLLLLAVLAACGGKSPAPTPPAAPSALPDVAFDKLDQDQRIQFMKQKVMPAMKPLFEKHDAAKFADFGCVTCHGKQAKDGHFDMPNPELPKLDFGNMAKYKPEDLEWMKTDIMPAMAKVLQVEPYSPETQKGFGCLGCHTQAGQ